LRMRAMTSLVVVLQESEPQGAIDLRGFVVVRELECGKFAFKLVKYGTHVDQHCFYCRTEDDMIR